jgi:4-cresol dehydrogenase (hydroxylating) flavoprotein subunit
VKIRQLTGSDLMALSDNWQKALVAIVGQDHVTSAQADPYSFNGQTTTRAELSVSPASVEEVQQIVALAADCAIPVWTTSQGKNYAYGGPSPVRSGGIHLNLSRMNRIIAVDEQCGAVIIEPGVTFLQLHAHLRAIGSRLWTSVPDIGWGSVIGNSLERGFGYTAHGDHARMMCGLEVVLADGSLVRTGMGANSNNDCWPLYQGGFGPSLDGLFQQSNLGIVTKMGHWLMPTPQRVATCMVRAFDPNDLEAIVDALHPLMLDGTIRSPVVVGNATVIASMISARTKFASSRGAMTETETAAMAAALGLGRWNARFALYGSAGVVSAQLALVKEGLQKVPGATLQVTQYDGDVAPDAVHPADRAQMGIPSIDLLRMAAWRGGDGAHSDFSIVARPVGAEVAQFAKLIRAQVETHGFDYAGGVTLFARHALMLALVSFDKSDESETETVKALFGDLIRTAGSSGGVSYRGHVSFMDAIADRYDFNDHALLRLQERLKDAFDPEGILAPGKQGVWPRKLRT